MRRLFYFIVLEFILFSGFESKAQSTSLADFFKLPSVAPSSPNVASIEKFGNIPVDYSTGVPNISIPIWEIKCGNFSWPLSISYHASGIKVDEIASNVGLGWSFIGPGVISRSVIGKPDDQWPNSIDYSNVTSADYAYLFLARDGKVDSEYDLFNYSFGSHSGKFIIKKDGSIFQIPYTDLKITHDGYNSFTITDESGIKFFFDQKETVTTDANGSVSTYTSSWYLSKITLRNATQEINFNYITDGNSIQRFYSYSQSIGYRYVLNADPCLTPLYQDSYSAQPSFSVTQNTSTALKLNEITFPNGKATLKYFYDRQDIEGSAPISRCGEIDIYDKAGSILKRFINYQSYFYYKPPNESVSTPRQYRLRLDSIIETSSAQDLTRPYRFVYNSTPLVPVGNFGQDKWGYNNGHFENTTLLQSQSVNYVNGNTYSIGTANRLADTAAQRGWALNEIKWPTGGRTVFFMEPHQFNASYRSKTLINYSCVAYGSTPTYAVVNFTFPSTNAADGRILVNLSKFNFPGVTDRPYVKITDLTTGSIVFNMSNMDPDNPLSSDINFLFTPSHSYKAEAFVYTTQSNSELSSFIKVQWNNYSSSVTTEYGGGLRIKEIKNVASDNIVSSDEYYEYPLATPITPIFYIDKNYSDVTYRLGKEACIGERGCTSWDSGPCRVYYSASVFPISSMSGSLFLYSKVSRYNYDNSGSNNGKTEFNYDVFEDAELPLGGKSLYNAHLYNNIWKNGFLISKADYKKVGSDFFKIQEQKNEYSDIKKTQIYTLKAFPNFVRSGCEYQSSSTVMTEVNFFSFPIFTGVRKLLRSTTTTIDEFSTSLKQNESYEYSSVSHAFPTLKRTSTSDNLEYVDTFYYAHNFVVAGNVYDKMVNQNFISPVIQTKSFFNGKLISTKFTTYKDWFANGKIIEPEYLQGSIYSNSPENRVQFAGYDSYSNTLSVAKVGDAASSYLYDYNSSLPTAIVTNASQIDIAATSFESDGKGNWSYSGLAVGNPLALTGLWSYNLTTAFPITKTGLTSSKVYRLSYWTRNSSPFSIAGTQSGYPITGPSRNGWNYFEHKITGVTSVSISGTGILDELRLMPFDAQMETYTYTPLVGMTTSCDANNKVTYYEYDALQRLLLIRDQDRNIVKKYAYNYMGQVINDNIFYNLGKSVSVKKLNTTCSSCQIGSTVSYTVPANKYSATSQQIANQLEQADIDANAQNYANSFGSCSVPSTVPIFATNGISSYSFLLQFHNNCTGVNYNFTLNALASNVSLSGVPEGNYTVTLSANGAGTTQFTYKVNGFTQHTAVGSITLDLQTSSNQVLITP